MFKKILSLIAIIFSILLIIDTYNYGVFLGLMAILVSLGIIFPIKTKKEQPK